KSIPIADALSVIRQYGFYEMVRQTAPLAREVIAQDDARRYEISAGVLVKTRDGAVIDTLVVRPRSGSPVPALLDFTIYAARDFNLADAKLSAAHGYAGVVAYTRGKGRSPGQLVPYVHDGRDAGA